MAFGDPYITTDDLEKRAKRLDDGTFPGIVLGASRAVEQFTHRQFNRQEAATPRLYSPFGPSLLETDDFWTLDDLVVEQRLGTAFTPVDSDQFEVSPVNGVVSGVPGWPFWMITPQYGWRKTWRTSIRVTAKWGWEFVPEGVREATLNVAASVVTSAVAGGVGPVSSQAVDGYSVRYQLADGSDASTLVAMSTFSLAAPYRRIDGFA